MTSLPRLGREQPCHARRRDVEAALAFWRAVCRLELRGRAEKAAFIDLGDQFIALFEPGARDEGEAHFGLVVDDERAMRRRLAAAGAVLPTPRIDFRDPSGNRIQVVQYDEVHFSKDARVLRGMGLELRKGAAAARELRERGLL